MIGKIFRKSSGSFRARLRYIYGCTKHDHEIHGLQTIDLKCMSEDPVPKLLSGSESDLNEIIREFDSVERLRRMSQDSDQNIRPVFHAMLALRPGEALTPYQWRVAVQKYMSDLGFEKTNKYVAVMHLDRDHQHVHIVANRIRLDEKFLMVDDGREREKSINSVSEIEDMFGLNKAPRPKDTWCVAISHAELRASIKDGEIPNKHRLIAKIAGAIESTNAVDGDMFTFTRLLRRQKVYINLTLNHEGQPKGISFEFNGKYISGRQLKRSRFTWHKLTAQEGIHYDSKTIRQLEVEISRRDSEEQERTRLYYYEFVPLSGRRSKPIYVKFTAKEYQVQKLIKEILELIEALFDALFKPRECILKCKYIEYKPGHGLQMADRDEGIVL
ncbi:relaxase/mobilization nuclease domain-containing protein [Pseudomonas putida]|nr:relaxase/mobilization nuclease domain-containing protein [Pseudomonas putida]MBF8764246.1 relaxase/mobilization nuclease domain-containing protein [Pseudomonas putida]